MLFKNQYSINFLESIKKKIDRAEIVSFDIFDTLLFRPYLNPVDVFKHIGNLHKIEYFKEERVKAEKRARDYYTKTQEDITLDQIYEFMPDNMKYLKDIEFSFEKKILVQNKEMKEVFDYAQAQGKKIIISSDMYLPEKVLVDILISKGFDGFEKLYVSGEFGKSKFKGTLYNYIIDKYKVSPKKILHIGDNKFSDYKIPLSKGIKAVLYQKAKDRFFKINKRAKIFANVFKNSLDASLILGLNSIILVNEKINPKENYWEYFGFVYGGIVCYSYMKWIDKQVKENDIQQLLFIARDGYTLKQIYEMIKTADIETNYIYAPRNISIPCTLNYYKRLSSTDYEADTTLKLLINTYCKENNLKLDEIQGIENKIKFIDEHYEELKNISSKYHNNYKTYLEQFNLDNKKIAIVDTITTFFAAQCLIEYILKKSVLGLYWVSNLHFYDDAHNFYNFKSFDLSDTMRIDDWKIMEFIMTSPEAPIAKLENGKPVYKENISHQEQIRMNIYPDIEKGIIEFTKYVTSIFGNDDLFVNNNTVTTWINIFCNISTNWEREHFSNLGAAFDSEHENYTKFPVQWFDKFQRMVFYVKSILHKTQYD